MPLAADPIHLDLLARACVYSGRALWLCEPAGRVVGGAWTPQDRQAGRQGNLAASLEQGVEIKKEKADEWRRAGSTAEVPYERNEWRTAECTLEMTSNHRSTITSTSKLPRGEVAWAP